MEKARRYLYSNIYLFLPGVLISVLLPLVQTLLYPLWERSSSRFPECNYELAGSINLCYNRLFFGSLSAAIIVVTILVFLLTLGLIKRLHIEWLSPLFGIALFYSVPLLLFMLSTVLTNGIYGEARGSINNTLITVCIPASLVMAVVTSYLNYRRFSEHTAGKTGHDLSSDPARSEEGER
jgi:positive regulator of sigma E activity